MDALRLNRTSKIRCTSCLSFTWLSDWTWDGLMGGISNTTEYALQIITPRKQLEFNIAAHIILRQWM